MIKDVKKQEKAIVYGWELRGYGFFALVSFWKKEEGFMSKKRIAKYGL